MKVEPSTWVLAGLALASMGLVYLPGDADDDGVGFVSTRSAARRVFPALAEVSPESVAIELWAAGEASVRLDPGPDGHVVTVDGEVLGPADPDAVDGLVDSLRLATTLRAVGEGSGVGDAARGRIAVDLPSGSVIVALGEATPDDVGVYGELDEGDGAQTWVVEHELFEIVQQLPTAWLARRAVVVEPAQVTRLRFAQAEVARGTDGRWRSTVEGRTALLSTEAVEARIGRMVTARLDALRAPADVPADATAAPWVTIAAVADRSWTLALLGPCAGGSARVLLRRGPGFLGCIDAAVTAPWPLVGAVAAADAGAMVEPRLSPYGYGVVLRFEGDGRVLRRQVGDWVLEQLEGGQATVRTVDGAAVFDWYGRLHDAEVDVDPADPDPATLGSPSATLAVHTDSTKVLTVRCWATAPARCQRDQGPVLRLRDRLPPLALQPETFADKTLVALAAEDARAVEILAGPAGDGVRQSVHFDLGVWRLDAPRHPDGDEALSEVALDDLLAALGGLRAQRWLETAPGEVLRRIVVERTPRRGEDPRVELTLHPGCVVGVRSEDTTDPIGEIGDGACAALSAELLHPDPFDFWIRTARTIEVHEGALDVRFKRDGERLEPAEDASDPTGARARLDALAAARMTALASGTPPASRTGMLRVLPASGAAFEVHYGRGFAQLDGADWFYRLRE